MKLSTYIPLASASLFAMDQAPIQQSPLTIELEIASNQGSRDTM